MDNWNEFDNRTVFDPELLKKLNCGSKARLQKQCGPGQFPSVLAKYIVQDYSEMGIHGKMDGVVSDKGIAATGCAKRLELVRKAMQEGKWLRLELLYAYLRKYGFEKEAYGSKVRKLESLLLAELKQSLLK